jgi:hypothetical protein
MKKIINPWKGMEGYNCFGCAPNNEARTVNQTESNEAKELSKAINEMLFEWTKHSGTSKDPAEEELKKRKKRKKL